MDEAEEDQGVLPRKMTVFVTNNTERCNKTAAEKQEVPAEQRPELVLLDLIRGYIHKWIAFYRCRLSEKSS